MTLLTKGELGLGLSAPKQGLSRSGKIQTKSFFLGVQKVRGPSLFLVPFCCQPTPLLAKDARNGASTAVGTAELLNRTTADRGCNRA